MKKLLFLASDYAIGLSSLLTDEALALYRAGIDMVVACGDMEQEPGLLNRLQAAGVASAVIPALDQHANFSALSARLSDCMAENNVGVVHVQNNWQLALVVAAKRKLPWKQRPKIIYTLHGYRHNHWFKSIVARLVIGTALFLFADRIICMSSFLSNAFRLLKYKMELLPLGVSDAFFEDTHLPAVSEEGLQIIYPAQFRVGKNQDGVIRAFASYLNRTGDKKSHLTLPGSGSLFDEMSSLVASLALEHRVSLPGQCTKERVRDLYARCNVAVVASNSETFGQSIVEPFAMGRIVVTRRVGIATDIITDGVNGYLFDRDAELADIFCRLGTEISPAEPNAVSQQAKQDALPLKWVNIAECYQEMIRRMR